MHRYKGIVFDMDGTLIDSERLHIDSWLYVFNKYSIPLTEDDVHGWIGISDVLISAQINNKYIGGTHNILLEEKRNYFQTYAQPNVDTLAGVKEGLAILKHMPKAVATMSNSHEAQFSLSKTGIIDFFKGIVTANDVENHKPAPDCYLKACTILNLDPADCIGIEDSISGINASKNAGLFTIGVANTLTEDKLSHADLVLPDTSRVMDWLIAHQ
jgi:beta-phosphoglucomutase